MLRFDRPIVFLKRPITVISVAEALGVKPFELMHDLIALEVFVAPPQKIEDSVVHALGARIGVDFRIDEGGGSSKSFVRPILPPPPPPLQERERPSAAAEEPEAHNLPE